MNHFTKTEIVAILDILSLMMYADGRIDERENEYLNNIKKEFNFEESNEIPNSLDSLNALKSMNDPKKHIFADMMTKMMIVDGNRDIKEEDLFILVSFYIDMPILFNQN